MDVLIKEIEGIVGAGGLLTGDDVTSRPDTWPPMGGCQARAIVRPSGTREVSEVLRLCHLADQSVVSQGGVTGLVGGARTAGGSVAPRVVSPPSLS